MVNVEASEICAECEGEGQVATGNGGQSHLPGLQGPSWAGLEDDDPSLITFCGLLDPATPHTRSRTYNSNCTDCYPKAFNGGPRLPLCADASRSRA